MEWWGLFDPTDIVWQKMADSMFCGLCGNITTRHSEFSCSSCGRMLCDKCGDRCKDHPKETDET